jgi:hypothetical protein
MATRAVAPDVDGHRAAGPEDDEKTRDQQAGET